MTSRRAVSAEGLAFIKAHEGFRARASRLPDGRWLVGYSSIEADAEGREVTPEEAETRLRADLAAIEDVIAELVFAPLTQGQHDALVSLGFSIGAEAFRRCGVADALNEGRPIDAADVFDRWRAARVGDAVKPVDALVRRRAAEKAMFLAPEGGPVAASSALLRSAIGAFPGPASSEPEQAGNTAPIARVAAALPAQAREGEVIFEDVTEPLPARAGERAGDSPSASYPLRRDDPAAASATRSASGGSPGAPRARVPTAVPAAADVRAQWPWSVGGGGLALALVALANVHAAASQGGGGVDAGWVLAMVAGVLALGAGGYYAARRLAGLEDW